MKVNVEYMSGIMTAYNEASDSGDVYRMYAAIVALRKELEGLDRAVEIYEKHIHENMISKMQKDLLNGDIG